MRTLLAMIVAIFAVSPVFAGDDESKEAEKGESSLPPFNKIDKNGDEKLSWEEARQAGIDKDEFQAQDYNDDNKITKLAYEYGIKES